MISFVYPEKERLKKGFIHLLDPRVKLLSFFALILMVVITSHNRYSRFLVYSVMLLFMIVLDRIPLRELGKMLALSLPLLVFLLLTLFVWGKKDDLNTLSVSYNIMIKTGLCILSASILTLTTGLYPLIKALEKLKVPRIVPSILYLATGFVLLFIKEGERVFRAKESRSFGQRKKWKEVKTVCRLLPQFFLRTMGRSQRVYASMLSRGFTGEVRTVDSLNMGWEEVVFVSLFSLSLALSLILL